jgi:hypothetical protein
MSIFVLSPAVIFEVDRTAYAAITFVAAAIGERIR